RILQGVDHSGSPARSRPDINHGPEEMVETASLTRRELEDLVNVIAAEVVRQVRPSTAPGPGYSAAHGGSAGSFTGQEACEGCPRNPGPAAVHSSAIRLTPDVGSLAGLMDHTLL